MPKKISYYRRKADSVMQEWGRRNYKDCIVCGSPMSCLHHYFPKSTSSALRYDEDNLIPLCVGCHFKHHNGDPRIQNTINAVKGSDWLEILNTKKNNSVKPNKAYYLTIIENYNASAYNGD